ncbi:hypothetical protein HK101_010511 [Irineochytrium annulatum]|nr:hypothetical protein HK101_010511 [Irineochytrium annulatum]
MDIAGSRGRVRFDAVAGDVQRPVPLPPPFATLLHAGKHITHDFDANPATLKVDLEAVERLLDSNLTFFPNDPFILRPGAMAVVANHDSNDPVDDPLKHRSARRSSTCPSARGRLLSGANALPTIHGSTSNDELRTPVDCPSSPIPSPRRLSNNHRRSSLQAQPVLPLTVSLEVLKLTLSDENVREPAFGSDATFIGGSAKRQYHVEILGVDHGVAGADHRTVAVAAAKASNRPSRPTTTTARRPRRAKSCPSRHNHFLTSPLATITGSGSGPELSGNAAATVVAEVAPVVRKRQSLPRGFRCQEGGGAMGTTGGDQLLRTVDVEKGGVGEDVDASSLKGEDSEQGGSKQEGGRREVGKGESLERRGIKVKRDDEGRTASQVLADYVDKEGFLSYDTIQQLNRRRVLTLSRETFQGRDAVVRRRSSTESCLHKGPPPAIPSQHPQRRSSLRLVPENWATAAKRTLRRTTSCPTYPPIATGPAMTPSAAAVDVPSERQQEERCPTAIRRAVSLVSRPTAIRDSDLRARQARPPDTAITAADASPTPLLPRAVTTHRRASQPEPHSAQWAPGTSSSAAGLDLARSGAPVFRSTGLTAIEGSTSSMDLGGKNVDANDGAGGKEGGSDACVARGGYMRRASSCSTTSGVTSGRSSAGGGVPPVTSGEAGAEGLARCKARSGCLMVLGEEEQGREDMVEVDEGEMDARRSKGVDVEVETSDGMNVDIEVVEQVRASVGGSGARRRRSSNKLLAGWDRLVESILFKKS